MVHIHFIRTKIPKYLLGCFPKARYPEKAMASISGSVYRSEMLLGFCPALYGVLFCGLVLGSRYSSPYGIGLYNLWCHLNFFAGGVLEWNLSNRRSIALKVYVVNDKK